MKKKDADALPGLIELLVQRKEAEAYAEEQRIEVEEKIISLLGKPDEGSESHDVGEHKVTITQRVTRKLDEKAWAMIVEKIPEALRPVKSVTKLQIEDAGVRWLRDNEPGYYKILCTAMTEKDAKPSVKVE